MASRGPATGEPVRTAFRPQKAHYLIALGMGVLAGLVAAFGEALYSPLTFPLLFFGRSLVPLVLAVAIAPLVEETAKPLGLFLLKEEERLSFDLPGWTLL